MALDFWRLTLCVVRWNPLAMALQSGRGDRKCKHLVNPTDYMLGCYQMLGWFMYYWLLNCMLNCMIKHFYSSLPFLVCGLLVCGFLLLLWSSIYWCEQMWEFLVIAVATGVLQLIWAWFGVWLTLEPTSKSYYYVVIPCLWASFWFPVEPFNFVHDILVCLVFILDYSWTTVILDA